jgi:basic membrane lipoprotein Med (substrate-binding protein (PBP1-ABC) superfamily)
MNWMMKAAAAAVLCLVLAGCNGAGEQSPTPTLAAATQTAAPTVQPSATPVPTATALPGRLVLLSPPGAQNMALEKVLLAEAQKAGLILDKREALQPSDLDVSTRVVVALSQPANLAELQAAAPQAQFLVVSADALEPNDHLSVVRTQPEQLAFAAGFTAAMLSDDWRTAGLIANDTPQVQEAFRNGARYFCGDCVPGWPQKVKYPLVSDVPAAGDGAAWAAAAQEAFDNGKVEVFYLSADAFKEDVYAALAGKAQVNTSVKWMGSGAPPDALKGQWAATVVADPLEAIKTALPGLLAGKSAGSLAAPIQLLNLDPGLLSSGRLELIKQVIADLTSGQINPASVP